VVAPDSLWRLLHNTWGKPRQGDAEPLPYSGPRLCASCSISGAIWHRLPARMRRLPHPSPYCTPAQRAACSGRPLAAPCWVCLQGSFSSLSADIPHHVIQWNVDFLALLSTKTLKTTTCVRGSPRHRFLPTRKRHMPPGNSVACVSTRIRKSVACAGALDGVTVFFGVL
jgi:hypothetical protein